MRRFTHREVTLEFVNCERLANVAFPPTSFVRNVLPPALLSFWQPVRGYTCHCKIFSSIITVLCVLCLGAASCVAARLPLGVTKGRAFRPQREGILRLGLSALPPFGGRRIDWLDTSVLHFLGAPDSHVSCGWLLRLHLQHQAPELSAPLDRRVVPFWPSLPLSHGYPDLGVQFSRERAHALALWDFCHPLFSRCANLCAAENLETPRAPRCGSSRILGRGQRGQPFLPLCGHSRLAPLYRRGRCVLAGKPQPGDSCRPPARPFVCFLGSSLALASFSEGPA